MNIRGVSLKNRTGNLLVSIGEFFCRQGKKLHSSERLRYWKEAQKTLAEAEANSVPCPITFPRGEEEAEFERFHRRQQARMSGFDMNQPVCGSTGKEAPLLPMNHPYLRRPQQLEGGGDGGPESEDRKWRNEMGKGE